MPAPLPSPNSIRFGVFVFDRETGDFWNGRYETRLQEQSRLVLRALTDRPGELVGRDELRRLLWADDTFVDVDSALNVIVNKLRHALGDSAASPRFIETIPRRGYRFVAPVHQTVGPVQPDVASVEDSAVPVGDTKVLTADEPPLTAARQRLRIRRVVAACVLVAGAGALVLVAAMNSRSDPRPTVRAVLPAPTGTTLGRSQLALSGDASHVVVRAFERGAPHLAVTSLATGESVAVPQSADGIYPAFSPDGRRLAFCASGTLNTVDLVSMQVSRVLNDGTCGGGLHQGGIAWNDNGDILYGSDGTIRLLRNGETASVIALPGNPSAITFSVPDWLPDGRHFLVRGDTVDGGGPAVYMADAVTHTHQFLVKGLGGPRYVASDLLLYVSQGQIVARHFNPDTGTFSSAPATVAVNARAFAVTDDTLVYLDDVLPTSLIWMARDGRRLEEIAAGGFFNNPRLSPEGSRVAYGVSTSGDTRGIWVHDLTRQNAMRLTAAADHDPIWSADGAQVLYDRASTSLLIRSATGEPVEHEVLSRPNVFPTDWSADGQYIAFTSGVPPRVTIRTHAPGGLDIDLPTPPGRESYHARFSPDARWIAYTSDEGGGPPEVYVTSFPGFARKFKISIDGGAEAVWRRDGRELFFATPDNHIMSVAVEHHGSDLSFGRPVPLFAAPLANSTWPSFDASADGKRFLINAAATSPAVLHVLSNWRALIPGD